MPCGLISNLDYESNLKRILKEINAGNNIELKTYACSLKTPITNEGCAITNTEGKTCAFPFCIENGVINTGSFITLSFDQLINLWWKVKVISCNINHPSIDFFVAYKRNFKLYPGNNNIYSSIFGRFNNDSKLVFPYLYAYDEQSVYDSFGGITTSNSDGWLTNWPLINWNGIKQQNNTFYVPLDFNFDEGDNQPKIASTNYNFDSNPAYTDTYPTICNFFGQTVQAHYFNPFGGQAIPPYLTVSIESYWNQIENLS